MLVRALRFVAGGVAGFLLWWLLTPLYDSALAAGAGVLLSADARLRPISAVANDRIVNVRTYRPAVIPADQLTYNVVLFAALAAMRPPRRRALLVSVAVLVLTHLLALVVAIESTYATRMGDWSAAHYSLFEQHLWLDAEFFYRLAGMFAIAFACWWAGLPERD
jgi:hypothetical protein